MELIGLVSTQAKTAERHKKEKKKNSKTEKDRTGRRRGRRRFVCVVHFSIVLFPFCVHEELRTLEVGPSH